MSADGDEVGAVARVIEVRESQRFAHDSAGRCKARTNGWLSKLLKTREDWHRHVAFSATGGERLHGRNCDAGAEQARPLRPYNPGMRTLCWLLIGLAALAFAVGTTTAFAHQVLLLEPVGFWRGAVGFLLFAIALRMMDTRA